MTPPAHLTLRIDGHRITAERFLRAAEAFFGLVNEVAEAVTRQRKPIEWLVTVKAGSINLGAVGESRRPSVQVAAVVEVVYTGFQQLGQSTDRPAYFNDNALQSVRDLARLVDGKAVSAIQVKRSRNRFTVKERVVQNIDVILGGTLTEVGTIEGRLEMISSRGGLHVGVWDFLTDKVVRCNIGPEMIDEVKAAFDRRVAVSGVIRYRPNGEAVSIDVERLEIFPDRERLPSAEEIYGILAKF